MKLPGRRQREDHGCGEKGHADGVREEDAEDRERKGRFGVATAKKKKPGKAKRGGRFG